MILFSSFRSFVSFMKHSLAISAALLLFACGGGSGGAGQGTDGAGPSPPSNYIIGGAVSGLSGTVGLQNNRGDTLSISANGAFRFTGPLTTGQSYEVTVIAQPANQRCVVTAGSGVVQSTDINSIAVTCTVAKFALRGTVSGLIGTVVVRNNGGDDLTLSMNGDFVFPTTLENGGAYALTVSSQPANQHCSVTAGSGSIDSADVGGIGVSCVFAGRLGGTISGLAGTIVLQNNGTDDLSITTNGTFAFATPLPAGTSYQIGVLSQPLQRKCEVASGSGTVGSTDVSNIVIVCVPVFAVGGTVSGLVGAVVLKNGADRRTIDSDGAFTFGVALLSGTPYAVSVESASDPTQRCLVSSGNGTINSADISTVKVVCTGRSARYRPETYSSFTSLNGTGNLEGTWVLLSSGTMSHGYQIAGINPRNAYQLWSRTTVRIRRDQLDSTRYFIFTCGPAGSKNSASTITLGLLHIPFYAFATNVYFSYGMTIEDATTMRANSVSRSYSFTGNTDGSSMGWNLSWVLKRISDDPLAAASTARNNLSGQSSTVACAHESEGTYAATQHDGTSETARTEGLFFWTDAYGSDPLQLADDANGFPPRLWLRDEIGFNTSYRGPGAFIYHSADGAQFTTLRNFSGAASSHSIRAVSADGSMIADDTLDVSF